MRFPGQQPSRPGPGAPDIVARASYSQPQGWAEASARLEGAEALSRTPGAVPRGGIVAGSIAPGAPDTGCLASSAAAQRTGAATCRAGAVAGRGRSLTTCAQARAGGV